MLVFYFCKIWLVAIEFEKFCSWIEIPYFMFHTILIIVIFSYHSYRCRKFAIGSATNEFATRRTSARPKRRQTCTRLRRQPVPCRHIRCVAHLRRAHRHQLCRPGKMPWAIRWAPVVMTTRVATMSAAWATIHIKISAHKQILTLCTGTHE